MSLFQHSVLNKYLKEANQDEMKFAYQKLVTYFHNPIIQQNIRESKEEQFQEGFLRELFVNVFGYTINPTHDYNLTTEFKNERGAKKADGAILVDGAAIGVIELKSTKTKDLESIRLQAFDYKANQQKCVYVITSNFEKVRFYINNAVEYEEFDLFRLEYEHFQLLWLCLAKENLLKGIPLAIKEDSLIKEENITKQIYIDYTSFKRDLYNDLIENNLDLEIFKGKEVKEIKLQLFKKSQKLLDRFLFIFFGEDRGLLPPNSISEILKQWEKLTELDEYKPLYQRFKKYFNYLNTGWKGKNYEIFAYNGGLFAPDDILDRINISDELLRKHTKVLTAYDFESEVDVNILGHIFENSLNEIEEITAQIEGVENDLKKSKRKKDGVFYTPKYITKFIVENTVGKLCLEKRKEIGIDEIDFSKKYILKTPRIVEIVADIQSGKGLVKRKTSLSVEGYMHLENLEKYRNFLLGLTILDPACGSGAFLNQALDFLIKEHDFVTEQVQKITGDVSTMFIDIENQILENNIFGVDINEESIEIAKLSLWLRTAQKGRKLTTLSNNIKCGNSLIDDPEIAGEKAFNWQNEFPKVFKRGGFDVVIGNPPWGAKMSINELEFIKKVHKSIIVRMIDSFMFFVDKSLNIINSNGFIGLIVPDVVLYQKDNQKLREKLLLNTIITHAINVGDGIFEEVARPSAIIIAKKSKDHKNETQVGNFDKRSMIDIFSIKLESISQKIFKSLPNSIFATKEIKGYSILNRLSSLKLGDIIDANGIQRGISPDLKDAFIVDQLTIENKKLELPKIHRTVTGGVDVKRFNILNVDKNILYISRSDNPTEIPNIINHIADFRDRITCTEVAQGKHPFYSLHRTRDESIFLKVEKIIGVITGDSIITAVDERKLYPTDGLYILAADSKIISNKALSTILNSKLITYLYRLISSESDRTLAQVKPVLVSELPIVVPDQSSMIYLEKLYNEASNGIHHISLCIKKTSKYIEVVLKIDANNKLQNWYNLEFSEFINALNNAKNRIGGEKLSKIQEMEWLEVFETKKAEAQNLKAEIEKTDHEIDQMVYELYGLTEEEIRIVEGSC